MAGSAQWPGGAGTAQRPTCAHPPTSPPPTAAWFARAVAGIDVNYAQVADGVTFTWPTYKNGLAIITTSSSGPTYSIWSFLNAFTWQVGPPVGCECRGSCGVRSSPPLARTVR